MKILVIFTGGTIGSILHKGWISTDSDANYTLLDRYRSETKDNDTQFDILSPCTILSENLSEKELNLIIEAVCANLVKDYDGIIVTHGTDTIQFTAAAIENAVEGSAMPVVIVSSDYPLTDIRANGTENFIAAVELIKAKRGGGVYVAYKNESEDKTLYHIPSRLLSFAEASSALFSIDGEYGYYDGVARLNKSNSNYSSGTKGVGAVQYIENPQILTVNAMPCDSFSYSLENVKIIIFRPYHSGTLNTGSDRLVAFCKKAKEKNIPMFLVNVLPEKNYESMRLFNELGIISLQNSAYPAVFMRCWLGISMKADIKKFVENKCGVR